MPVIKSLLTPLNYQRPLNDLLRSTHLAQSIHLLTFPVLIVCLKCKRDFFYHLQTKLHSDSKHHPKLYLHLRMLHTVWHKNAAWYWEHQSHFTKVCFIHVTYSNSAQESRNSMHSACSTFSFKCTTKEPPSYCISHSQFSAKCLLYGCCFPIGCFPQVFIPRVYVYGC